MSKRDDPLDGLFGATPSTSPATAQPKPRRKPARERPATSGPAIAAPDPAPSAPAKATSVAESWVWESGIDVPKTHRYPLELMDQLDARTKALDLPVGLTVAAALATFLDLPDDELIAAVERAQTARKPRLRRR